MGPRYKKRYQEQNPGKPTDPPARTSEDDTRPATVKFWCDPISDETKEKQVFALVRSLLTFAVTVYLPVANAVLQYFACTRQSDDTQTLNAQPSIVCYEGTHMRLLPLAIIAILLYILGIPMLLWLLLNRTTEEDRLTDPHVFAWLGFLYARYRTGQHRWELVVSARKIGVILACVFLGSDSRVQCFLGISVLGLSLASQIHWFPYNAPALNRLETVCVGTNVATLLCGMVFLGNQSKGVRVAFTVLLLTLLLGVVAIVVFALLYEMRQWRRHRDITQRTLEATREVEMQYDVEISTDPSTRAARVVKKSSTTAPPPSLPPPPAIPPPPPFTPSGDVKSEHVAPYVTPSPTKRSGFAPMNDVASPR